MELYLSESSLKRSAIKNHAIETPNTSPNTTQKAEAPTIAPKPVSPSKSHADSPVALDEKATAQKPSFLPPT